MSVAGRIPVALILLAGFDPESDMSRQLSSPDQSKYYEVFSKEMTWNDADVFCKERHGDLATIRSEEDMNSIVSAALDSIDPLTPWPEWFWIGGTKIGSSRGYYWITDGTPISSKRWFPGGPTKRSDCVQLYGRDGKWGFADLEPCRRPRWFICEYFQNDV